MSEVTITNIGRDGVASEATLQSLVNKLERHGKLDKDNLRQIENMGKEAEGSGKKLGKLGKATEAATKAFDALKGRFADPTRLNEFSRAFLGYESVITRATTYADELLDTFRTLSASGASFNNNMLNMLNYSTESALSLEQFTSIVQDNTEILASHGGTVTEGAKRFAAMSKELRTGVGADLFNMGFTVEELNEGLLDYMDLERRRFGQNIRNDRELAIASAGYLKTVDELAKLTGKQRDQIKDLMTQQTNDARIRVIQERLQRQGGDALDNFNKGLTFVQTKLEGPIADGFLDLVVNNGNPLTPFGKVLRHLSPEFAKMAGTFGTGKVTLDQLLKSAGGLGTSLEDFATANEPLITAMTNVGGMPADIVEVVNALGQLRTAINASAVAAKKEADARSGATGVLAQFEQIALDLQTGFLKFFKDLFGEKGAAAPFTQALKDLGSEINKIIGPAGKEGFKGLKSILEEVTKGITPLFAKDGVFTLGVKSFSEWLSSGGLQKSLDAATLKITEFSNYLTSTFYSDGKFELFQGLRKIFDAALDGVVNILVGGGDDTGGSTGLIDRIFAKLTGGMDSATGGESLFQKVVDSASIVFDSIFDSFKKLVFGPKTDTKKPITDLLTEKAGSLYDEFKKRVFGEGAEKQSLGDLLVAEFEKFVNSLDLSLTKIDKKLGDVLGLGEGKTFSDVLMEWLTAATNKVATTFKEHMPDIAKAFADGLEKNAEVIGKALGTVINNLSSTVRAGASSTVAEEQTQGFLERAARSLTGTTAEDRAKNFVKEYMKTNNVSKEEAVKRWWGGEAKLLLEQHKKEGKKGPVSGIDRLDEIKESLLKNQLYTGTGGKFVDFGSGTPAMLHGREMVIPENDIGNAVQALTGSSVNGNIDTMKQLNSNVQVMIKLLATQNAISNQQLRATKGMGNDYYRGVMR